MPGTVGPDHVTIRPPKDPPRPFLVPRTPSLLVLNGNAVSGILDDSPQVRCDIDDKRLDAYLARHDVETTLCAVFKDREDREHLVAQCLASLRSPFTASSGSDIVWSMHPVVALNPSRDGRMAGKKTKDEARHKILKGAPWSIVSLGDPREDVSAANGEDAPPVPLVVRRNMIYDDEGDLIAQIDFGHGTSIGIHLHALIKGRNLEHRPGDVEDHAFPFHAIPWPWLCVPAPFRESQQLRAPQQGQQRRQPPPREAPWSLPETVETRTGMSQWCAVTVPFEDFMGRTESSS